MHEGKYLIVQIDMGKHPRQIDSAHHTGDGVLLPVSCDGYYGTIEAANSVAAYLAVKDPALQTYMVKIVKHVTA